LFKSFIFNSLYPCKIQMFSGVKSSKIVVFFVFLWNHIEFKRVLKINMNKKNELLLVLILMTLFGATGCSMMMAPPGGLHEDIGPQTDFKKSFSVVYNIY
jgi:hypothetical protein